MTSRCSDSHSAGALLLDALGPMRVINLPHRADRRSEFASTLSTIGLSLDDPRVALFSACRPDHAAGFPTLGARGCFLSHLQILRDAESQGLEGVIVCEDDLDFSKAFNTRVNGVLRGLASCSWQMMYAGHGGLPETLRPDLEGGLIRLSPDCGVRCTHFLIFRRELFGPLIAYLEAMLLREPGDPSGGPMHVDGAFNHFRRDHPGVHVLAALPALGHQRPSRTDIHPLSVLDRWPGVRSLVAAARRVKRRLKS